jgi:predicted nucleotidyltransferase
MTTDIQIIRELKRTLQIEFGDDLRDVILFGSRVTDLANENSDYDILIVLSEKPDWMQKRKISEICYEAELQNEILIDSHILSESELVTIRGMQPIFQRAIKKGIHV